MIEEVICGKEYKFFLISGEKINGVVKEVFSDYITLGKISKNILNRVVVSETKTTYHISIDKIECIQILEEKI